MHKDTFVNRHNGPRKHEVEKMLAKIGVSSVDELIDQTIPDNIRLKKPVKVDAAVSEFQYHKDLKKIASKNKSSERTVRQSNVGVHPNNKVAITKHRNGFENKIFLICIERDYAHTPPSSICNYWYCFAHGFGSMSA